MGTFIDTSYFKRTQVTQKILLTIAVFTALVGMIVEGSFATEIFVSHYWVLWVVFVYLILLYIGALTSIPYDGSYTTSGRRDDLAASAFALRHFEWVIVLFCAIALYFSIGLWSLILIAMSVLPFWKSIAKSFTERQQGAINRPVTDSDYEKTRRCRNNADGGVRELAVSFGANNRGIYWILNNWFLIILAGASFAAVYENYSYTRLLIATAGVISVFGCQLGVYLFFLIRRLYWRESFWCSARAAFFEAF